MEDYGHYTLEEIATKLDISRERVRQIEKQALKKLKHPKLRKEWREINETVCEVRSI